MSKIILHNGDIFCTRNPMFLGRAINFVQKFHAKDNESTYSHAGIIYHGGELKHCVSFEALWTNKKQNFYEAYKGQQVLIGRHKDMTEEKFQKGWNGIKHHEDKAYAGWRLPLFFVPFLAKYMNLGLCVCSEMQKKFLCKAGVGKAWKGWNPDDCADMIHKWRDYEIVYEGVLK